MVEAEGAVERRKTEGMKRKAGAAFGVVPAG